LFGDAAKFSRLRFPRDFLEAEIAEAGVFVWPAGLGEDDLDDGLIALTGEKNLKGFVDAAKRGRIFDREPKVRTVP
jgi:hypothetical protein